FQFAFSKDGQWASIIANEFERKADVIARGFSGYNSRQCKALLPYLKNDFEGVSIVGVFLGANDANDPKQNPQQAVPLKEYKGNLKSIVDYIKGFNEIRSVFLVTPPALDEEKWNNECVAKGLTSAKTAQLVGQYANACEETAKEMGVPCINLHTPMLQRNDWKEFLSDGLHFSAKGSEFVASEMVPRLKDLLKREDLYEEEGIMPLWGDVDNKDPDSSFREWMKNRQK
ncbi:UNVERIFIED_CONTAM: hypothetical protein GTU68_034583, partial [Idotea baltica]|nr:hypothetical protein [Idotea baltica]